MFHFLKNNFLFFISVSQSSGLSPFRFCAPGATHICISGSLGRHIGWIYVSEIDFRREKLFTCSRETERGFFVFQQLAWIRRVNYSHLQNRGSVNQLTHLLSVRLQINPNFRNNVHEFLIHHLSYNLYINSWTKRVLTNDTLSWICLLFFLELVWIYVMFFKNIKFIVVYFWFRNNIHKPEIRKHLA
jgi:hypothetical protein